MTVNIAQAILSEKLASMYQSHYLFPVVSGVLLYEGPKKSGAVKIPVSWAKMVTKN